MNLPSEIRPRTQSGLSIRSGSMKAKAVTTASGDNMRPQNVLDSYSPADHDLTRSTTCSPSALRLLKAMSPSAFSLGSP